MAVANEENLEVWTVRADAARYPGLYVDEAFFGTPFEDYGKVQPLYRQDKDNAADEIGTFAMYSAFIAMSEDAREVFEPAFGRCGEFLPIRVDGVQGNYYLFNTLRRKATIDWRVSRRGVPLREPHYLVFDTSKLVAGELYIDAEYAFGLVTVEGGGIPGLKGLCEAHGFTGLRFIREYPHEDPRTGE